MIFNKNVMNFATLHRCRYSQIAEPPSSRRSIQLTSAQRDACRIRQASERHIEEVIRICKRACAETANSSSRRTELKKNSNSNLIGGEKVRAVYRDGD